jgi:hypothetical protein
MGHMFHRTETLTVSDCNRSQSETQGLESKVFKLDLSSMDPGTPIILRDDAMGLVGPQFSAASRFTSFLIYGDMHPVIRNGCLLCAYGLAKSNRGCVIDRLSEKDLAKA